MSDYVLITDSACDFTAEMQKENDVEIIPIPFSINGKEYKYYPDCREYPVKKFYEELAAGAPVSTAAINMAEYNDFFEPFAKEGKNIIYLCFSAALSSTFQNARNVARELEETYNGIRITIIDSISASCGQGLYTYLCAQKRLSGASYDELVAYAEEMKYRVCHEFSVDDLGQLKRGGRISAAEAFFGSMLQIKPMLYISPEGKLIPYDKVRGRKIAVRMMADKIIAEASDEDETPIFIGHGDCEDDAMMIMDMVKEKLPKKKFVVGYIGPVVGAHSGYRTLAIFTVAKDRGAEREKKKA